MNYNSQNLTNYGPEIQNQLKLNYWINNNTNNKSVMPTIQANTIMATIIIFTNGFPTIKIPNIDVTTFNYYGPTDGYDWPESKQYDFSAIGFVADNAQEVVDKIKATFKLNPNHCKVEDYIDVRTEFFDYEKDKRPRIRIRLSNGAKGIINPPSFEIVAD